MVMSDVVPLLPEAFEPPSSPVHVAGKLRARTTGPFSASNGNDEPGLPRHRRDGSNAQDPSRCCKKNPPTQKMPPKYPIAFIASTWGFLTNIERAIILPTMWLYFKNSWGEDTAAKFYGSTLGVFSLSILIATPIFGFAGHSKVSVKVLLLVANFFEIVGNLAYLFAKSPWLVFIGRLIAGLGASCEPPMYADLTRSTEFHERTPFIIVLLLSRQVGLIFGPAFTLILNKLDLEVFDTKVSVYNGPGLVMTCLWVLHSILIFFFYPSLDKTGVYMDEAQKVYSTNTSPSESTSVDRAGARADIRFAGFKQYSFITLYATTFASYYSVMALESVLSPLANRAFDWGAVEVSYIYIAASVLIILVSSLMHLMSKCVEDRKLIVIGLGFLVLAYVYLTAVIFTLDSLGEWGKVMVVVGVAIHVIGMPFPLAISESLYTKFVPSTRLDQAQTILRTVINVAFLVGPYVGGSLHAHPSAVFLSMLFMNLIPFLMFLARFRSFQVTPEMQMDNAPASSRTAENHHLNV